MTRTWLGMLILCGALAGCNGTVSGAAGPSGGPGGKEDDSSVKTPAGQSFAVGRDGAKLLPFSVRLKRVAAVVGVGTDHPALASLVSNRIALGDYDYAHGVLPDLSWSPSRIALWVKALRPVCASTEFQTKFPNLPEELPTLVSAALGREATQNDLADFDMSLAEGNFTPEQLSELTCLAVLSSAEMVYQ